MATWLTVGISIVAVVIALQAKRDSTRSTAAAERSAGAAEKSADAAGASATEQTRARLDLLSPRLDATELEMLLGPFSVAKRGNPPMDPIEMLHELVDVHREPLYRPGSDDLRIGYIVRLHLRNSGTAFAKVAFNRRVRVRSDDGSIDELNGKYETVQEYRLEPGETLWFQCSLFRTLASWIDSPDEPASLTIVGSDGRADGVREDLHVVSNAQPLKPKPGADRTTVFEMNTATDMPLGIEGPRRYYLALSERPQELPWRQRSG